jgi:acyl dehydratase
MLSIPASTSVFNLPFLAGKTIQARCHLKEKKKKKKKRRRRNTVADQETFWVYGLTREVIS